MKKISTTRLSKSLNVNSRELFKELSSQKLIYRKNDTWCLTKKGQEYGGETITSKSYGEFVVWPPDFDPFHMETANKTELLNATAIGKVVNLSSQKVNLILSEIGWSEKAIKGWSVTSLGKKVGGVQFEFHAGGSYVMWPKQILDNKSLLSSMNNQESDNPDLSVSNSEDLNWSDFRKKFPPNYRTRDGHVVRSRAEVIIDNALYYHRITHAYERKLPVQEEVYSDFYIPSHNGGKAVYIEYWGMLDDQKYANRKKIKRDIYAQNELNLIEIDDKHIENLDDYLPKMLLKFGIRVD